MLGDERVTKLVLSFLQGTDFLRGTKAEHSTSGGGGRVSGEDVKTRERRWKRGRSRVGKAPGLFAFGPLCCLCPLSLRVFVYYSFEDAEEEEDGVPPLWQRSRTPHNFTGGCWTGTGKRSCRNGEKTSSCHGPLGSYATG